MILIDLAPNYHEAMGSRCILDWYASEERKRYLARRGIDPDTTAAEEYREWQNARRAA